jgi:hypothetical protein
MSSQCQYVTSGKMVDLCVPVAHNHIDSFMPMQSICFDGFLLAISFALSTAILFVIARSRAEQPERVHCGSIALVVALVTVA